MTLSDGKALCMALVVRVDCAAMQCACVRRDAKVMTTKLTEGSAEHGGASAFYFNGWYFCISAFNSSVWLCLYFSVVPALLCPM